MKKVIKSSKTETEQFLEYKDLLIELAGVSEETINVVCNINGFSEDTLKDILYVVSGYKDFEEWKEDEVSF